MLCTFRIRERNFVCWEYQAEVLRMPLLGGQWFRMWSIGGLLWIFYSLNPTQVVGGYQRGWGHANHSDDISAVSTVVLSFRLPTGLFHPDFVCISWFLVQALGLACLVDNKCLVKSQEGSSGIVEFIGTLTRYVRNVGIVPANNVRNLYTK